jgi:hypothetical protein
MAQIKNIELAQREMFTPREELLQRYDEARVAHLMRIREMYNWMIANPSERDRKFIDIFTGKFNLSQSAAYADLALVKQLVPALAPASREFYRKQVSEMLLETYNMAKARKDTKAMAMAAKELGKVNRVDLEDEKILPYEQIVIQPFTPSSDPTIIGLKVIPNVDEVKARLKKQMSMDNPDIEDVDFEEADLEEDTLFPEAPEQKE